MLGGTGVCGGSPTCLRPAEKCVGVHARAARLLPALLPEMRFGFRSGILTSAPHGDGRSGGAPLGENTDHAIAGLFTGVWWGAVGRALAD